MEKFTKKESRAIQNAKKLLEQANLNVEVANPEMQHDEAVRLCIASQSMLQGAGEFTKREKAIINDAKRSLEALDLNIEEADPEFEVDNATRWCITSQAMWNL